MSAGGNPNNVQLGPGRLYVAPLGTTEPVSASAALAGVFRAVGYTEEGSAFSTVLTNQAVDVAEELDPILYVLSRRENTLALAMAETTRRNLSLAMGGGAAAANDATAFEPPDPGDEVAVVLVWDSKDDPTETGNVRWIFRQAKAGGTITLPRRKAPAKASIAVTFSLEKPSGSAPFKVFPNASGLI